MVGTSSGEPFDLHRSEGKVYTGRSLYKEMVHVNVEAGLRSLWTSLREMKDLLTWQELVEAEKKPGQPPSFSIDHHTDEDLKLQYGFFVKTALDIHEFLNSDELQVGSKAESERWRNRLSRLEEQCRKLKIAETLIKA